VSGIEVGPSIFSMALRRPRWPRSSSGRIVKMSLRADALTADAANTTPRGD
jgi:hypothetical protein